MWCNVIWCDVWCDELICHLIWREVTWFDVMWQAIIWYHMSCHVIWCNFSIGLLRLCGSYHAKLERWNLNIDIVVIFIVGNPTLIWDRALSHIKVSLPTMKITTISIFKFHLLLPSPLQSDLILTYLNREDHNYIPIDRLVCYARRL